uniref:Glycosyl hydrolase family 18 n=1 Tax=Pecoramyces ruminantium TaxID=1987568 RepID=A0A2S1TZA5_9FUNG|nr:Glycosyl hydrolase family 18 [Pecoramyces ruminantium]
MKLLYLELLVLFIYGALANHVNKYNQDPNVMRKKIINLKCHAFSRRGRCSDDCPCVDGTKCSEDGFCKSNVLEKRYSCSALRLHGKCNSDCPCTKKGECCSKYGFCGSSEKYCGKSSSSSNNTKKTIKSTTTKKSTSTTKPKTTKSSNYGSEVTVKTTSSPGVIIYLPSYRLDTEIDITKYDLSKINIINYCFFQITDDGEAYAGNYEMDIEKNMIGYVTTDIKKKYPHIKVILTIGGTEGSKNFKNFLKESYTRDKAAKSIVKAVNEYNFDGLDIDWEFPKNEEEASNLLSFIKRIREYMGYEKYLTISASALTDRYYGHTAEMEPYLNWFNLMTYHYAGYWSKYTGFNAPLYTPEDSKTQQRNSNYTVEDYLKEGVPPLKLVLGASFMGQAWLVYSSSGNGYNQSGDANIYGEPSKKTKEGFWSYRSLRTEGILTDKKKTSSSWVRTWHDEAKSPTIFNKSTKIYISYDDVDSMCERSKYVKNKEIGGIMVWEAGQDYNRELIDALLDCYY